MSSLDLRFYQDFEKSIISELEKLSAEIISGKAIDYSDYKGRIGRIKGLEEALNLARETQREVLGIDRK
jgi:hypothetical protein